MSVTESMSNSPVPMSEEMAEYIANLDPAIDYAAEPPYKIVQSFDSKYWTVVWMAVTKKHPEFVQVVDFMRGWFANALMAGFDHARKTEGKPNAEHEQWSVYQNAALREQDVIALVMEDRKKRGRQDE